MHLRYDFDHQLDALLGSRRNIKPPGGISQLTRPLTQGYRDLSDQIDKPEDSGNDLSDEDAQQLIQDGSNLEEDIPQVSALAGVPTSRNTQQLTTIQSNN